MQNPVTPVNTTLLLKGYLYKVFKFVQLVFVGILLLAAFYTLAYIFNLDLSVMKPSVSGVVTAGNIVIPGAKVKLGALESITNNLGEYSFSNLDLATYDFSVQADGYEAASTTITVGRGFLNYVNKVNLEVKKAGIGQATGKVIVNTDPGYIFLDEFVLINNKSFLIEPNGTFSLKDIPSGQVTVQLQSDKLVNTSLTFNLTTGQTAQLPEIVTNPAGDIAANLFDYITNQAITTANIDVQNVLQNQISLNDSGQLKVQDLVVGQSYLVRIISEGYITRSYTLKIAQGINPIPTLKMVPDLGFAYTKREDNKLQVFTADLDGINQKNITAFTANSTIKISDVYANKQQVYFLSDQDRVRSTSGGSVLLAYTYLDSKLTKVTTNTTNLGEVTASFNCEKLLNNITSRVQNVTNRTIQIMDLTGNNRQEVIKLVNQNIDNVVFSSNCDYIFYNVTESANKQSIYQYNINSNQNQKILDDTGILQGASSSGNQVVFSKVNTINNLQELFVYDLANKQTTLISQNIAGNSNYQFLASSNNTLLYIAIGPDESNIYSYSLNNSTINKVTNFSGSEQVKQFYQFNNYIFYETNRGLYVIDFSNPVPGVLVTSDFISYTSV